MILNPFKNCKNGLSLRTIHIWLVITMVIWSGIVNGRDAKDKEDLFEQTDAAMYRSKKSGKHTYTFND